MISAFDVANYFLWKAQNENQELLSNMKLQKLVYYAQGLYFSMYNKPLFSDKIEAWNYGPVIVNLYHKYKHHEANGIPAETDFDPSIIDDNTKEFLDDVYDTFGQFSAIRLMEISHSDKCWQDAGIGNEMTLASMRKCLPKKYIKNE